MDAHVQSPIGTAAAGRRLSAYLASPAFIGRIKPALFILCLVPLAWLIWDAFNAGLGADPIKAIIHRTGSWTLRFLLITLTITPLRKMTGWHALIRLRRMFGLFAFFYACLHFLSYVGLDQTFDLHFIIPDVIKHKYVLVGFASFLLLIPLAATSTNGMVRRLGGRRWQRLHRLVYVIAIGGVLHFLWLVKSDIREPLLYGAILALLLSYRVYQHLRGKRKTVAAQN
jgi:sulfoxide reductase heme-binding subunit YedZ